MVQSQSKHCFQMSYAATKWLVLRFSQDLNFHISLERARYDIFLAP